MRQHFGFVTAAVTWAMLALPRFALAQYARGNPSVDQVHPGKSRLIAWRNHCVA